MIHILQYCALGLSLPPNYNSTLLELVALKNVKPRYDLGFDKISSRFTPEDPSYYEGLITEGWWAVLLCLVSILTLFSILYSRFRYNYFGGKNLKNTEFTTYVRWAPGFLLIMSFLLFFISGMSLLIESSKITAKVENLGEITYKHSKAELGDIESTYQSLISTNMQHVGDSLYVTVTSLNKPLQEATEGVKMAKVFKKDVKQLNNRRVISTLVVFCLGLIFYLLGALGFALKIESLGYGLAVSMGVLASLNFLVAIPYVMERVASTDFCEQIIECTVDNSLPVSGYEIGYYFSDFSKLSKDQMEVSIKDIMNQLIIARPEAGKYVSIGGEVSGAVRLESFIWKDTVSTLEQAVNQIQQMKNSFYIKSLCENIREEVCGEVFGSFMLAEFTIFLLAISFFLGLWSGLLAPRVFTRWRQEEERSTLAKHNLYNIRGSLK